MWLIKQMIFFCNFLTTKAIKRYNDINTGLEGKIQTAVTIDF